MAQHDDLFRPESIDEQIDQCARPKAEMYSQPHDVPGRSLIHDLEHLYQPEAQRARHTLERAWQRIERTRASTGFFEDNDRIVSLPPTAPLLGGGASKRRGFFFQQSMGLLAAMLIVILLIGSVLTVFGVAQHVGVGRHDNLTPTVARTVSARGTTLFNYHDQRSIYSVNWSPDGKRIAAASNAVRIWDVATGRQVFVQQPQAPTNFFVALWSPDGTRIAATTPVLEIWDATTGQKKISCSDPLQLPASGNATALTTQNGDPLPVPGTIAWSPDGRYIAQAYQNARQPMIIVWDATTCKLIAKHQEQSDMVFAVAWSPDSKYIAFSIERAVEVWDFPIDKVVYTYHDPFDTDIYRLAWSPDSKRIASTSYGSHTVEVWDATTGRNQMVYRGHSRPVFAVAWSPDGKFVASGSSVRRGNTLTGEVQIWDAARGQLTYTYRGNTHTVLAIAWSPDGKLIASADGKTADLSGRNSDGTVEVWSAA